jgi:hypothetical protein
MKDRALSMFLSAVLTLLLVMPYVGIAANAATTTFVYEGAAFGYVRDGDGKLVTGGRYHETGTGYVAYCLDYGKDIPDGFDYSDFVPAERATLDAIIYYGYQRSGEPLSTYPDPSIFTGIGDTDYSAARYATQLAIWATRGGFSLSDLTPTSPDYQIVITVAERLVNKAKNGVPSNIATITPPVNLGANANPNSTASVRFGPFKVSNAASASVSTTNNPAGSWIGNASGGALTPTSLPIGTDFYV